MLRLLLFRARVCHQLLFPERRKTRICHRCDQCWSRRIWLTAELEDRFKFLYGRFEVDMLDAPRLQAYDWGMLACHQ
jgi:hypothetical protein